MKSETERNAGILLSRYHCYKNEEGHAKIWTPLSLAELQEAAAELEAKGYTVGTRASTFWERFTGRARCFDICSVASRSMTAYSLATISKAADIDLDTTQNQKESKMSKLARTIENPVKRILDTASHPTFTVGNNDREFGGIEVFGKYALSRASLLASEVVPLIDAAEAETSYVEALAASIKTILANSYFEAALITDGLVAQPVLGGDSVQNAHRAADAVRDFLDGAAKFEATYLQSGATCIGANRKVQTQSDDGEHEITITIREDLAGLLNLINSARGHLISTKCFSFWSGILI